MSSSFYPEVTDELLSSYIDGAVNERERNLVETAAASDPEVAWRLETLRHTVMLLREMSEVTLPHSFALPEAIPAAKPMPAPAAPQNKPAEGVLDGWRSFWAGGNPVLRNAMAASMAILLVLLLGNQLLPVQSDVGEAELAQITTDAFEQPEPASVAGVAQSPERSMTETESVASESAAVDGGDSEASASAAAAGEQPAPTAAVETDTSVADQDESDAASLAVVEAEPLVQMESAPALASEPSGPAQEGEAIEGAPPSQSAPAAAAFASAGADSSADDQMDTMSEAAPEGETEAGGAAVPRSAVVPISTATLHEETESTQTGALAATSIADEAPAAQDEEAPAAEEPVPAVTDEAVQDRAEAAPPPPPPIVEQNGVGQPTPISQAPVVAPSVAKTADTIPPTRQPLTPMIVAQLLAAVAALFFGLLWLRSRKRSAGPTA